MKRRDILKQLTAVPFTGAFLAHQSILASPGTSIAGALSSSNNIYDAIGVDTIINCRGTFTILGGSIERPEVLAAMEAASGHFVQYDELAYGVGRRLAELTKAEWGMISAGCAAGLKHVTAACVTGGNPEKLIRIPDLSGFEKTQVIIPRHSRNAYDHAVRNVGVDIVMVDSPQELEQAINKRTAMIYVTTSPRSATGQPLSVEVIAGIAKSSNIPVLVDAAAEDLTIPPVHLKRGATIVAYSGGKAICGPQCAGLLLGDKKILMSAWQASSPHHGPGRDNKVGKEEMLGMVAAVEAWTTRDHQAEWDRWLTWLDEIAARVQQIDGVKTHVQEPQDLNNRAPVLHISWDPDKLHITGDEIAEEVARNKPRIAIGSRDKSDETSINITPNQMQEGEAGIVAERLFGILSQKRTPKTDRMTPAKLNVSGHWLVEVEFFSSKSQHHLFLRQDGNWIQGSHKTDFAMQEIVGIIEGDEVKLRSIDRRPGNAISYYFSGKASGDKISGDIYLGEYLTAKYTAHPVAYKQKGERVVIPGGPPLAT